MENAGKNQAFQIQASEHSKEFLYFDSEYIWYEEHLPHPGQGQVASWMYGFGAQKRGFKDVNL